jgi:hypothetical protein
MLTNLKRYLISGLVIIPLTLSSLMMMGISSISNAKDISDQKTRENLLQLRNAIRLTIYESCFIDMYRHMSDGQNDMALSIQFMKCLGNGLAAAKRQFGIDLKMIEE